MNKYLCIALLASGLTFNPANAAEITTCIIDTSIKSNKVFYYFPLSSTLLQCDHLSGNTPISLKELYALNWRMVHLQSPVKVEQGSSNVGYTPPVIYLERTTAPSQITSGTSDSSTSTSDDDSGPVTDTPDNTKESEGAGLFNWLGGDSVND